jgi:spermidine synthase
MPVAFLYAFFFCSGVSGLIYQVVWVREFGNVFGATIHTASLVIAIFMLGLGCGSFVVGRWSDRRYRQDPESPLRAYALFELAIASLGIAVSVLLPHLHSFAALTSSYVKNAAGWWQLSLFSYAAQGAIALVLLGPSAMLMGGTLALLVRYRVRADVERAGGWKIAALYAVNTAGAAAGAFLTDFALVPAAGLRATQMIAVVLNLVAMGGALGLARASADPISRPALRARKKSSPPRTQPVGDAGPKRNLSHATWTSVALMLSGFAAMGMEILWLRHFNLLLGGFRAVFSLVLTIVLAGIGAGALVAGAVTRGSARPERTLMLVQALLVAAVFIGLASNSAASLEAHRLAIETMMTGMTPLARRLVELWYNVRPILIEIGPAALLMGAAFPLGNAVVQHAEESVGRRTGVLYLANTFGAVCGSLLTGYVLLPVLGMQGSITALMLTAGLAILSLAIGAPGIAAAPAAVVAPALIAAAALTGWLRLPSDFVLQRSLARLANGERLVAIQEGVTEVVAVTEIPGRGRSLMTNGHAMSSTAPLDQRYMRALAHIPLLSMSRPSHVLVIGFGVGNTTEAATRHPSITRVDVVDLSSTILGHAADFSGANHDVLRDRRVAVFVNDGRQHLQMQAEGTYDLITLEPPPVAHAGVGALYSREFYELARTRLKPGGYISQWLPAYQVPVPISLAMTRAFLDVFPRAVLLSGTQAELLLLGTTGDRIEVDPSRLALALANAPDAAADLRRIDLGTVAEIVGTFVGSAETLARATRASALATDDRPLQEYSVQSVLGANRAGVPADLVDLPAVNTWCPRCFDGEQPAPAAVGLDTYLALLDEAYHAPPGRTIARGAAPRRILDSAYLGAVVPDNDSVYNIIGVARLREGRNQEAAAAFSEALQRRADSADAHRNLGTALAAMGRHAEAIASLRRAVQLAPENGGAEYELGNLLIAQREYRQAADALQSAVRALPDFAPAHNSLGIALASLGDLNQAIEQFRQAVQIDPEFEDGHRNLTVALQRRR